MSPEFLRNITNHSFEAALFEEDDLMKSGHVKEYIAYLIIDNPNDMGFIEFPETTQPYQLAQAEVDHRWTNVLGHELRLQEEQSADNETFHVKETVDLLLINDHLFAQIVSFRGSDQVTLRKR